MIGATPLQVVRAVSAVATFSNVEIAVPSLAYVPDTGYPAKVESTLETIEVDGVQSRRVVRHFDGKIEAPNWTRDGKALVYNAGGRIWRIPVEGGEPVAIPTGRNIKNNNDHGISPDGKQLVISDQSEPDNLSRIFVLPLGGSDQPRELVKAKAVTAARALYSPTEWPAVTSTSTTTSPSAAWAAR